MATIPSCPACDTPLGLFTPRERTAHVNACLDQQAHSDPEDKPKPECAVCNRDLTALTPAARLEHANRCADSTLPLGREAQPPRPRRVRSNAPEKKCDEGVKKLLALLGLGKLEKKFAEQEIDLVALRLLTDDDLVDMKIPENARRQIARALQSVQILAQIEGRDGADVSEDEIVPTQQFRKSRLADRMKRNTGLLQDEDSDGGEFDMLEDGRDGGWREGEEGDESVKDELKEDVGLRPPLDDGKGDDLDGNSMDRHSMDRHSMSSREALEGLLTGGASPSVQPDDGDDGGDDDDDDEVSSIATLKDIEKGFGSCSQITLHVQLEKWREKQESIEREKFKRAMDRIRTRYERMQKRLCMAVSEVDNSAAFELETTIDDVPAPDPSVAPQDTVDLTHDSDDGVEQARLETPQNDSSRQLQNEPIVISTGTVRRKRPERFFNSDDEDDDVLDFQLFRELSTEAKPSNDKIPSRNDGPSCKLVNDGQDAQSEEEVMDLIERESPGAGQVPTGRENDTRETGFDADGKQSSEEEVMDLVGSDKENVEAARKDSSNGSDEVKKRASKEKEGAQRTSPDQDMNTPPRSQAVSRLKRPRKVNPADIRSAIRSDKALYDDMLMMVAVPFTRVLESVRGAGVNVSKKALVDLLQQDGVSFKPDVKKSNSSSQYFMRLNSECE